MDDHDRIMTLCARMLTCATYITQLMSHNKTDDLITVNPALVTDAGSLLTEAAAALERLAPAGEWPPMRDVAAAPDLGKPMDIIEPPKPSTSSAPLPPSGSGLTDPGVPEHIWPPLETLAAQRQRYQLAKTCPKCDSRAMKTVIREGRSLRLLCPVCSATWAINGSIGEARWV